MGKYCLIQSLADKFKKALRSGELNPEELAKMSSEERHNAISKVVGEENATNVNSLFEKKLLQKNRWNSYLNWAKEVTGIKPEIKRDLISRIEKMSSDPRVNILNPEEEKSFLNDLVNTKLGMNVTYEEAGKISELSQKMAEGKKIWSEGKGGKDYAVNRVAMERLIKEAKLRDIPFDWSAKNIAEKIAGNAKSMKATLDDSFAFRQGLKSMWTHPITWSKDFAKSFGDMARGFKNGADDALDAIKVEVYSRDNFINGNYKKMKLDLGGVEEAFPATLGEKIPLFKRLYNASEVAYNGMGMRLRADIADSMLDLAGKQGVDLEGVSKKGIPELQSIGRMVNSLTGRGHLGKLETIGKEINVAFFSPKFLKSHIDVLLNPLGGAGGSSFVKKEASKNLLKIVTGTASVLFMADRLWPGSVEWDPSSTNFGKIKIGATRFDVTGGMGSIITLASRMTPRKHDGQWGFWTKSSSSNQYTQLNKGFGAQTVTGLMGDFFMGKLSPTASVAKDLLNQKDMQGNPITLTGELNNMFTPLPITNAIETLQNPNSAPLLVNMIADGFGISTNTYSSKTNWNANTGIELQQFKDKIGQDKFDQANTTFNQKVTDKLVQLSNREEYKKLSDSEKSKVITKMKDNIKSELFKQYKFNYSPPKTNRSNTNTIKSLSK